MRLPNVIIGVLFGCLFITVLISYYSSLIINYNIPVTLPGDIETMNKLNSTVSLVSEISNQTQNSQSTSTDFWGMAQSAGTVLKLTFNSVGSIQQMIDYVIVEKMKLPRIFETVLYASLLVAISYAIIAMLLRANP